MSTERFVAQDMRSALKLIKAALGNDAILHNSRKIDGGVEVQASAGCHSAAAQFTRSNHRHVTTVDPTPITEPFNFGASMNGMLKQSFSLAAPTHVQQNKSNAALSFMQHEMALLRSILERRQNTDPKREPRYQHQFQRLVLNHFEQLGLPPNLIHAVIEECDITEDFDAFWQQACQLLACQIPVDASDPIAVGGIFAFIGPTGVGKTTTVAKLASRYVMEQGADDLALISTDCYRVAGREQLGIYGQILNVPVMNVKDESEMTRALDKYKSKRLVLIDTAGISQRDISLAKRLALFASEKKRIKNYLVLSATSNKKTVEESIDRFGQCYLFGSMLTKLDEATELGNLISVFIENKIHLDYISTGQRVPQDIQLANGQLLVDKMLEIEHPPYSWLTKTTIEEIEQQGVINAC